MIQPLSFPSDAISITPVDITETLTFSISVKRRTNPDGLTLEQFVQGIDAGTHSPLDRDTFTDHFGAFNADLYIVSSWAEENGLTVVSSNNRTALVKLSGTIEQINSLFGITLSTVTTPTRTYNTYEGSLAVPNNVANVITYVFDLDQPHDTTRIRSEATAESLSGSVSLLPTAVASAYQFPDSTGAGTCIALLEFGGGFTAQNIQSSFVQNGLPVPNVVVPPTDSSNNISQTNYNTEVMLDIYVAGGVAPGATIAVYFINTWQDILTYIIDDSINKPSVISISWARAEGVTSPSQYPLSFIATIDSQVFSVAKAMGITIVAASGDYGSTFSGSSSPVEVCWPASSPYVLGVGGTSLTLNVNNTIAQEIAWYQGPYPGGSGSGGGLSQAYTTPSWQSGLTYTPYSRTTGNGSATTLPTRGVPDVAANADPASGYQYYAYLGTSQSNKLVQYGGTSAAAPLWAGLIARLNSLLGKNMGYVNPYFYQNTRFFNDITVGNNATNVTTGYAATTGWDAVTGLGTPNGQSIYLESSPPAVGNTSTIVAYNSSNNILPLSITNVYTSVGIVSLPTNGTANVSGLEILYTPNIGYTGTDTVSYNATNSIGTSPAGIVSITVIPPDLPIASNSNVSIYQNSLNNSISLSVTNFPVYFDIVTPPLNGTATTSTYATITYTPTVGFDGSDSFSFQASNINGISNTATVNINVQAVPLTLSPTSLANDIISRTINPVTYSVTGGTSPYFSSASSLPSGLTFNTNTFILSGTPTIAGTFTFTVAVVDSSYPTRLSTSSAYSLYILNNLYWITSNSVLGQAGPGVWTPNPPLQTSDPTATFNILSGSLPPGLSMNTSTGVITGNPVNLTTSSNYIFTVRASSQLLSQIADKSFSIYYIGEDSPVWVTPSTLGTFIDRDYVSIQLEARPPGGALSDYQIRYNLTSIIPNNLTFSPSGIISGILDTKVGLNQFVNKSFTVEATNGYTTSTQTFVMTVTNTSSIQAPEFINGTDLGIIKDNSNQYLPVTAYDPEPWAGPLTYSTSTVLPLGLTLDTNSGYLYGHINAQTNYRQSYNIPITATKVSKFIGSSISVVNTFTLTVLQSNADVISWSGPTNLGTLIVEEPSNLHISATHIQTQYPLVYSQVGSTALPGGLTLTNNGDIIGVTTASGTYTITVVATTGTVYNNVSWANTVASGVYTTAVSTAESFTFTVKGTSLPYTNIYLSPLLPAAQRTAYNTFINNSSVFPASLIYRADDPNFGLKSKIKAYLEYGIQELNSSTDYVSALQENFHKEQLYFGPVSSITAIDNNGNAIYDVVYVPVSDHHSSLHSVQINGKTYYPGSLANMKSNLASLNSGTISINPNLLPLWQQTAINSGVGFINGVVICYANAKQGAKIVSRVNSAANTSGFNFNQLKFTIDRIVVEQMLSTVYTTGSSYLIFPNTAI